jgi:hypothetical protein
MNLEKLTLVLSLINLLDHEAKRVRLAAQITSNNLENIYEEALKLFRKQESKYKISERLCV